MNDINPNDEANFIGVILGSFSPMHKGHMGMILQAKKIHKKVIIAVCGFKKDKGEKIGLPLDLRYKLISEFFKDDPIVTVVKMDDNELGIVGYNDQWAIWTNALEWKLTQEKGIYNKGTDTLLFYTGEKTYSDALLAIGFPTKLFDRNLNPISATLIRDDPMLYWSYIAKPFKPYFQKRILIIGTASEGKTTMALDLAKYFDCDVSTEYGHDAMEYRKEIDAPPTDCDLTYDDFHSYLVEQYKRNTAESSSKLRICDSDAITTLMYAKCYSEDERYKFSKEDYQKLLKEAQKYILTYTMIFVVPTNKDSFVQDGTRDSLHSSYAARKTQFGILAELLSDYYYQDEMMTLTHDRTQNFEIMKDYISWLLSDDRLEPIVKENKK